MERPVYLKTELFEHILGVINSSTLENLITLARSCGYNVTNASSKDEITETILDKPASFLEKTGLLDIEDWLINLVIELDDGVEYFITENAAKEIVAESDFILLTRLIDKKMFAHKLENIREALRANSEIDYLDTLEKKRKGIT
jgi:hypothetical protein